MESATGAGRHFGSKESSKSAYRRRPLVEVERVSAGAKGLLMVTEARMMVSANDLNLRAPKRKCKLHRLCRPCFILFSFDICVKFNDPEQSCGYSFDGISELQNRQTT